MKKNILALILSAIAVSANAGDWYVGADAGQSKHSPVAYTDDAGSLYGVNAGYAYNNNLAVEITHADLGRTAVGAIDARTTAADISVIGTVEVGARYGLYGRLGYAAVESTSLSAVSRRESLAYGAGVSYRLTDVWSVRGGLNRYGVAGGDHVTNAGLGLRYNFR